MCLIAFIYAPNQEIKLKLIANRDEFYARPSAPLAQWAEAPIIAGRDLQAGGTWIGVTPTGRMAALTNHRNPKMIDSSRPSRGHLVCDFLTRDMSAQEYIAQLQKEPTAYNPFNLLCFDGRHLLGFESRLNKTLTFTTGVYAVSNADFDTPWLKLNRLKNALAHTWIDDTWLSADEALRRRLFELLRDTHITRDDELPQTGIPIALERMLSAIYVNTPSYGTRASTLLAIGATGVEIFERSFVQSSLTQEEYVCINRSAP